MVAGDDVLEYQAAARTAGGVKGRPRATTTVKTWPCDEPKGLRKSIRCLAAAESTSRPPRKPTRGRCGTSTRLKPDRLLEELFQSGAISKAEYDLKRNQLGAQEKLSRSGILATLFVERIFDGLTLLSLIVISTLFIPVNDQVHALTITTALIFFGALAVFCLVAFSGAWRQRLLTPVLAHMPGKLSESMSRRFDEFVAGLGSLRRGRDVSMVLVTSFASWLAELGTYLFVAQAFHLNLGIAGAMLTMGVANVFTLIPSSPGYVGPFEAGTVLVLQQILHFPSDLTVAYALVIHATLYFPVTIAGAFYWFRHHLSMNAVSQAQGNATTVAGD